MSIKSLAVSRLNYDWIGLAVGVIGVVQLADLSWMPARWSGALLLSLGVANVALAWYRAQVGVGGQRSL